MSQAEINENQDAVRLVMCQKQGDKLSRVLGQNYFPSRILHSTEVSIKCEDRKKMCLNPLLGNKQNKSFNKIKIKRK